MPFAHENLLYGGVLSAVQQILVCCTAKKVLLGNRFL